MRPAGNAHGSSIVDGVILVSAAMKYQMFGARVGLALERHDPTPSLLSLLWTSATSVRVRATDIAAHSFWTHSCAMQIRTSGVASRTSDDTQTTTGCDGLGRSSGNTVPV